MQYWPDCMLPSMLNQSTFSRISISLNCLLEQFDTQKWFMHVSHFQVQTRSADEPMTTFVFCNQCGNRWKVRWLKWALLIVVGPKQINHFVPCPLSIILSSCTPMVNSHLCLTVVLFDLSEETEHGCMQNKAERMS